MIFRFDRWKKCNVLSEWVSRVRYVYFINDSQRSTDIQMAEEIEVPVIEGTD